MSAMSAGATIFPTPPWGTTHPGVSFLFCNDWHTSQEQAQNDGQRIARAIGDRLVKVLYNPATSEHYQNTDRVIQEAFLALKFCIVREVAGHCDKGVDTDKIRVVVFAHGHGALIAQAGIRMLHESRRELVEVHAFGGFVMLQKDSARIACNYVHPGDATAVVGNNFFKGAEESLSALKIIQRIRATMEEKGVDAYEAIEFLVQERLRKGLLQGQSLFLAPQELSKEKKAELLDQFRQDHDRLSDEYRAAWVSYDIQFTARSPFIPKEGAPCEEVLLEEALHHRQQHTLLDGYGSQIRELGDRIVQKLKTPLSAEHSLTGPVGRVIMVGVLATPPHSPGQTRAAQEHVDPLEQAASSPLLNGDTAI